MASAENLNSNSIYQIKNGEYKSWSSGMYVRKFAPIEIMYAKAWKYASDNTVQAIWLEASSPIIPGSVENSLYTLAEKYPPLQLCAVHRRGSYWFKVMEEIKIDFEEYVGDPLEMFHKLLATTYDIKHGPLWKVRLVVPKLNTEKYTPVLIFCIHHTITDAWTNTVYCREVVRNLNEMVSGVVSVPDERIPLAPRVGKYINLSTKSMLKFYGNYVGGKVRHAFRHEIPKKSFLFKNLIQYKPEFPETKVIFTELSEEETAIILKECKENNITINTFMVTMSNFALVDSVEEKKKSKAKYHEVLVAQTVDMRRYYKTENKDSAGCHIGILETRAKTPVNGLGEFWKYAEILHQDIKKKLDKNYAAKLSTLMPAYPTIFHVNKLLTNLNQPNLSDYHYCSTNMGNLSKLLGEERDTDVVKIVNFLRSTNREYGGCLFNYTFQTFKSKMLISVDYYPNKISGQDVDRYFAYLIKYLKNFNTLNSCNEDL